MPPTRAVFLSIYLLSGFAALVYEVVWSRLLSLHMGHTVAAVSTVLGAFMTGLAIGAAAAGVVAPRLTRRRALQVYAALEAAIAVMALLLPFALSALRPLLAWAYADGQPGVLFPLVRLGTALGLITLPAIAMGATFPVVVRWFVRVSMRPGYDVGLLYAGNTLGAALGAASAGFLLIPSFGLRGATLVAVALNIAAAGISIALTLRDGEHEQAAPARVSDRKSARRSRRTVSDDVPRPQLAAAAVFVSGLVAMLLQVAWTRVLALIVGPTTFAFSAVVAAFITGLAIGSAVASALAKRVHQPILWLATALWLGALGALLLARVADRLPYAIAWLVARPDATFTSVMATQSAAVVVMFLPMTVALGAAFPLAVAAAGGAEVTISRAVARLYVANTLGAIIGALGGGFLFVPALGLQDVVLAASVTAAVFGGVIALARGTARGARTVILAGSAAAVVLAAASPAWDREMLSSGAYKYAPYVADRDLQASLGAGRLLYYDEGPGGTVSVRRLAGALLLAIDGKVDASNASDMLTQKLLGHVPMLLHPDARDVAIVGLGSGVTLGATLLHPVRRVDMLEISPQVVEAASLFAGDNRHALGDKRTNLLIGDGRSHLLLSSRRYDVIISEPSNPWMAGVATLFTQEFFKAARARLSPAGLFCQWAHTYDISDADLRSIVATFRSVFPDGTMWLVGEGDLLLIGGLGSVESRLENVARTWARQAVASDLDAVHAHDSFAVLSLYLGGGSFMARYAGGAPMQTDDQTSLEFSAPRSIYGQSTNANVVTLHRVSAEITLPPIVASARSRASATQWRNRGLMELSAGAYRTAYEDLARVLREDPSDEQALEALPRAAAGCDRMIDATALMRDLAERRPPVLAARRHYSRVLAAQGMIAEAFAEAEETVHLAPDDLKVHEQFALLAADAADLPRLQWVVGRMDARWPDAAPTLYARASLLFLGGRFGEAAAVATRLLALTPRDARVLNLLGAADASLGQLNEARRAFEASLAADPRDPAAYVNLGVFELNAGDADLAAADFAEALSIDAQSTAAVNGLAEALTRQGHEARAARLLARAAARPKGKR